MVHEQFIEQMGDEGRKAVIGEAVRMLTGVDKDGKRAFGESPLEYAFKTHIRKVAEEVVGEIIESDPEIREKMKAVASDAIHGFLDHEDTRSAIAEVFISQFARANRR